MPEVETQTEQAPAVHHPPLPTSVQPARGEGYANVPPTEAHELIQGSSFTYLDVRTPEEYQEGHADGSVNVPLLVRGAEGELEENKGFLEQVQSQFPSSDTPIVTACMHGRRGEMAAQRLADAGFANLRNITGGFAAWANENLPTSK